MRLVEGSCLREIRLVQPRSVRISALRWGSRSCGVEPLGVGMRVAVFGLGYVGTVTAACLAAQGHQVTGVDVDAAKVTALREGRSPVVEPGLSALVADGVDRGLLQASGKASEALAGSEISLVCVGTPASSHTGADLTFVHRVFNEMATALSGGGSPARRFHAVVVRSTVPPGTVEDLGAELRTSMAGSGVEVGIAMCPEFLREGSAIADFHCPPYTVVGTSSTHAASMVHRLFGFLGCPFQVVDVRTAEGLKYACNAFHATKVAFSNELGRILRELGVDARAVMDLLCQDHQLNISARYLRPGFAFGGSCLPKDLKCLLHVARMHGIDAPLLSGTLMTNALSVTDVVERIVSGTGRTVALVGLSFKADSDDLRESPYVDLAETLLGKGYDLRIFDPVINPATLVGANRAYVASRIGHLSRLLTEAPGRALLGADVAVVSYSAPDVQEALAACPPPRIIDLDGRLGPSVERLTGYEGALW